MILLIAAAIVGAATGDAAIPVTTSDEPAPGSTVPDCCGVRAEGGGGSYIVAGLVAAAAAATAAGLSDVRYPFRRGQDAPVPAPGELTVAERRYSGSQEWPWGGKNSMYRFHVEDPIRFERSIRATIEAGHDNALANDYSSTAYWYQLGRTRPLPSLPPVEAKVPRRDPPELRLGES